MLWGRCYEEPGAPPFWPWLQVIRACAESYDDARLRMLLNSGAGDLAEILPELAHRMPDLPAAQRPADATQARFRLFDAITAFWKRVAADAPHLLVLDNLHWADAPTCACSSSSRRRSAACASSCSGPTATSSCRAATRCRTRSASSRATRGSSACALRA